MPYGGKTKRFNTPDGDFIAKTHAAVIQGTEAATAEAYFDRKLRKSIKKVITTFVTDGIESAVRQARDAAGNKDVQIIGSATTVQQFLEKGLADELQLDIMPIFLFEGFRPFENIGGKRFQLERFKVAELPSGRTHLRFHIIK